MDCLFFHLKAAPRSCTKTLCLVWVVVDCPFTPEVSVDCPFIPEGCPEELYEDALPGLDGGGLVGEGGLEEGGDDVCQGLRHILLQGCVRVFPKQAKLKILLFLKMIKSEVFFRKYVTMNLSTNVFKKTKKYFFPQIF